MKQVKEYALAEIFDAVTMPPLSETPTNPSEDVPVTSATVTTDRSLDPSDREEAEEADAEQNNETLRKKSKKSNKSKSESTDKLLKSLINEYSRDERAKKNRRGRKSAHMSKSIRINSFF